jgi:hypothetical protein
MRIFGTKQKEWGFVIPSNVCCASRLATAGSSYCGRTTFRRKNLSCLRSGDCEIFFGRNRRRVRFLFRDPCQSSTKFLPCDHQPLSTNSKFSKRWEAVPTAEPHSPGTGADKLDTEGAFISARSASASIPLFFHTPDDADLGGCIRGLFGERCGMVC